MNWSPVTPSSQAATVTRPPANAVQAESGSLKAFLTKLFSTARAQPDRVATKLASHREGMVSARQQVAATIGQGGDQAALAGIRQTGNTTARNPLQKFLAKLPGLGKLNPPASPGLKAKTLVPSAKNSPLQVGQLAADAKLLDEKAALHRILNTAPATMKKQAGWDNLCQRMENYLDVTAQMQGKDFKTLLNTPGLDFNGLLGSLRMYSSMDSDTARKMSFERDLANMSGMRIKVLTAADAEDAELNNCVLGCEQSYVSARPDGKAARPGNQVSIALDTVLRKADGTTRKVTILSCSAPALDTSKQPEWKNYVDANGALVKAAYKQAIDKLKEHMTECGIRSNSPRAVLTGIGTKSFLGGLKSEEDRKAAAEMVAQALAEVAGALQASGKTIAFYDKDGAFCNQINQLTKDAPTVTFLGKLESDWEEEGDLILNAWDPHSLLGNGLEMDTSADGLLGRHTLIHFQHAMACAMYAEGML